MNDAARTAPQVHPAISFHIKQNQENYDAVD